MPYDLFISYRRRDAEQVLRLEAALRGCGVSVWLDQHAISEFAPITDEIRDGLAQSKAFLAWYSEAYLASRPCQMELTAALLAAQADGDPRRRVLVINPERHGNHIEPVALRDAQYAAAPSDSAGYASLAQTIAAHIAALVGPLGAILPVVPSSQVPVSRSPSSIGSSDACLICGGFIRRYIRARAPSSAGRRRPDWPSSAASAASVSRCWPGSMRVGSLRRTRVASSGCGRTGHNPTRTAETAEAGRLEQFLAMAVALGIETRSTESGYVEACLREKLSQRGQPFLWIVDDLAPSLDAEAVKAWLAPAPAGKTLVTTRSREYASIGRAVPLDVLTPAEALELLCSRRTPSDSVETAAAHGITQDLGYHALAVDVAAAALAAQAGLMSFVDFRVGLANATADELELAAELADVLPSGHEASVAATILRSVRDLPDEGRDFLRLAALLAVAPIPPSLVASAFLRVDGLAELDATRRAIRGQHQVEQASLAERGEGEARLVHAVISRTVRLHEAQPERAHGLREALVEQLGLLLWTCDKDIRRYRLLAAEVSHARSLLDRVRLWNLSAANLGEQLVFHDCERGLYVAARSLQERVLETRRRELGEDHARTLTCMADLATILWRLGDHTTARQVSEQVIAAQLRVFGEEASAPFASMSKLAQNLRAYGDLAGARELLERVVQTRRRLLGPNHLETLLDLNHLAETLRAQGDLAGAHELHERLVQTLDRVLDQEHFETPTGRVDIVEFLKTQADLASMDELAGTLRVQGDLATARRVTEHVIAAQRRVLGAEHPVTLTSMNHLATILRAQGDLAGSGELLERVVETWRRVRGEDDPDLLIGIDNLAATLKAQGDLATARQLTEHVVAARRRVLGQEHPATIASMNNLAGILVAQGDLAAAREWLERSLELCHRVRSADHLDVLVGTTNLAMILKEQGNPSGARELLDRVLETHRRVLGEDHPTTLTTMNNLAVTLFDLREWVAALRLMEDTLETRRRVLGEDHPDTLSAKRNLIAILLGVGEMSRAHELTRSLPEMQRGVLGEDDPSTRRSANTHTVRERRQSELARTRPLHERVLETLRRALGI